MKNETKVVRIDEKQMGWSYDVHLSNGSCHYIYAQMQTWGKVWYQRDGYLQIDRNGKRTPRFHTDLIEIVLEHLAARELKALASEAASTCSAPLPAEPQRAPKTAAPRTKRVCNAPQQIRRCMAIALEMGLDITAKDRMRAAFSKRFERPVASRSELSLAEWYQAGSAIKAGDLVW